VVGDHLGLPVKAATKITQGKAVGDDASGYARQLVAGDPFRGHSVSQADNTDGAAGDINVELLSGRYRLQVAVTGATAVTDVESLVYASNAETYTLTKGSNTLVGKVVRWISSTQCVVEFDTNADALAKRSAAGVISIDDDVLMATGKAIKTDTTTAHTLIVKGYDVDGSTYDALITVTNGDTPTLTLAADGGIFVSNDVQLANGKAIMTDTTTAHTLEIQGYDVDGSTRPAMISVANSNAPTITISNTAANGVGFYGKTPATQAAHVADVATNLASDSTTSWQTMAVAVNGLFTLVRTLGLRATA
jgi:hypothetical protein